MSVYYLSILSLESKFQKMSMKLAKVIEVIQGRQLALAPMFSVINLDNLMEFVSDLIIVTSSFT